MNGSEITEANLLECCECGDAFIYRGRYAGQLTLIYALGEDVCDECLQLEKESIYDG